uniref:Elongation factor 1-beta n=1 Tax=Meloidogyne javanica TaxID=6303 RepID=A0A915LXW3_MELJA
MAEFNGLLNGAPSTEEQFKQLNEHLATRGYLKGFLPSSEDSYVFGVLKSSTISAQYPHVARWFKHMQSFSDAEQTAWPKSGFGGSGPAPKATTTPKEAPKEASKPAAADDFDLFGSDESDDEEKKKLTEQRLKAYAEKKAKKPGVIAKSNVIYDVKPWDDTIDLKEMEKNVRSIATDGLVWGASKIEPVAFGINKLQICCCVEDEKVSTDWLEEEIRGFEDLVQSVDVVAFNKV